MQFFKYFVHVREDVTEILPEFDHLIRASIQAYFFTRKKFVSYIAWKKRKSAETRYEFYCTCDVGFRTTPCVHGLLLLYMYTYYLQPDPPK